MTQSNQAMALFKQPMLRFEPAKYWRNIHADYIANMNWHLNMLTRLEPGTSAYRIEATNAWYAARAAADVYLLHLHPEYLSNNFHH